MVATQDRSLLRSVVGLLLIWGLWALTLFAPEIVPLAAYRSLLFWRMRGVLLMGLLVIATWAAGKLLTRLAQISTSRWLSWLCAILATALVAWCVSRLYDAWAPDSPYPL